MKLMISTLVFSLLLLLSCKEGDTVSTDDEVSGTSNTSFSNGDLWLDNEGVHINAHGGGIIFVDNRYYWFGEHKTQGSNGNKANVGVHCYSSIDLYNWQDEVIAFHVSSDPASDIVQGCIIERPKVIFNQQTGQYVMWFHHELKDQGYNAALSGVAVASVVTGPYMYLESFRPNESMARDQTLFVDDDLKAYHIYASEDNATMHISLLSDDYLSPSGQYTQIFVDQWMEAPAICKRNGKYYFIGSGCTGWEPNAARAAIAESIWGPWTELPNPCVGVNNDNGLGPEKTFGGQSTFILHVQGLEDTFIAMFDMWCPEDAIDGRYLWLPIIFNDTGFHISWEKEWGLDEL